jgi:hypothetical protein
VGVKEDLSSVHFLIIISTSFHHIG